MFYHFFIKSPSEELVLFFYNVIHDRDIHNP